MKLDDLRKKARSGIVTSEPEKPKRARKHVQEMDVTAMFPCPECGSRDREVSTDVDILRNVQLRRFECLQCGSQTTQEVDSLEDMSQ